MVIFGLTLSEICSLISICSVVAGMFVRFIYLPIKKNAADGAAMKLGMQALLRSQMIGDYNKWTERGYAPIYARENFENCWRQYHSLGVNGVMDDLHEKFMDLPLCMSFENEERCKQ